MLVEVIAVTSVGAVAAAKFRSWGLAAVVMIGAGYYGEMASAGSDQYWIGFVLSMVAYGYILRELQNEGSGLKAAEAAQFEKIKQLILVGWIIYPLGYLAPVVSSDLADLRNSLHNC